MSSRSLWFESHLFADRAGRRAREASEALGDEIHGRILEIGDRLAIDSAIVAQQFYRHAAAIHQSLGDADFAEWVRLGESLLRGEGSHRDAALAHFNVPPKVVAQGGIATLASWGALARTIAKSSRRLAATFLETTAPLLGKLPTAVFEEWARQGLRLFATAGWRGEFLAQAFFSAAPHALPILAPGDFSLWADLGVALLPIVKESQFFATLPSGLTTLSEPERHRFLDAALQAARSNLKAAWTIYRELPAAIRRTHILHRAKVIEIFACGALSASEELAELAPVAGALVHDLAREKRRAGLDLAVHVAQQFPRASAAILRSLPAAHELAGSQPLPPWIERGLDVAKANPDAGLAYFALQSRTSLKVLEAGSTAASLNEVQGLLRKFIQMLSAEPVTIRSADGASLRSPLEEFPVENEVALPLRVDRFSTHEDNVAVYRFLAAQLAGRREARTYDATIPPSSDNLVGYLNGPDQPALMEPLFLLAEGFRVASYLSRTYSGLAHEQRHLAQRLLAQSTHEGLPAQSTLLDSVLLWLIAGIEPPHPPAWLMTSTALMAPLIAPLASHSATVDDSLAVARRLAEALARAADEALQASLADKPSDALSAEELLDTYIYDYDPEGDAPSGEAGEAGGDSASDDEPIELPDDTKLQLTEEQDDKQEASSPLSPEALQQLIEAGADLRLQQGYSEDVEGLGLYVNDLLGKLPSDQLQELKRLLYESKKPDKPAPRRWLESRGEGASFYYDEWDYHISDYRQRWCRLREVPTVGDSGEFFNETLLEYAALIPEVRRQFQKIRPDMYRIVRGLEDGEDFDLNAVVSAQVDRRAKRSPSSKLYTARVREERDVATLFLIDMSASTDEPLQKPPPLPRDESTDNELLPTMPPRPSKQRRIIDVTKEALVIMAEALEEIGDAYAIYGFSGHGRHNVEVYLVKSFNEALSPTVKGRIGGLEPKRSTRMGTALRHVTEKMASLHTRSRHIIMLSDGFPQDFDYGQDRRSNVYGLRDTTVALRECEAAGITPFCITVDKAGHDYLREMCDGSRYMVIDDILSLPRELPKIYQRLVGS